MKIRFNNVHFEGEDNTYDKTVTMEVNPFDFGDYLDDELIGLIAENEMENYVYDLFNGYDSVEILTMTCIEKAQFILNKNEDSIENNEDLIYLQNILDNNVNDNSLSKEEKTFINNLFKDNFRYLQMVSKVL